MAIKTNLKQELLSSNIPYEAMRVWVYFSAIVDVASIYRICSICEQSISKLIIVQKGSGVSWFTVIDII